MQPRKGPCPAQQSHVKGPWITPLGCPRSGSSMPAWREVLLPHSSGFSITHSQTRMHSMSFQTAAQGHPNLLFVTGPHRTGRAPHCRPFSQHLNDLPKCLVANEGTLITPWQTSFLSEERCNEVPKCNEFYLHFTCYNVHYFNKSTIYKKHKYSYPITLKVFCAIPPLLLKLSLSLIILMFSTNIFSNQQQSHSKLKNKTLFAGSMHLNA